MIKKKNKDLCADWMPRQAGHDRKEEQGRSMVEMLGVLAVVGVLSVGGIAGYTYAMNKHYANELLMGASERAVLVTAQIASGKTPNLNEFAHYSNVGGTFGQAEKLEDGSGFVIPVSGVKGAVCENLIKATQDTDVSIANDDETLSEATCDDENPNNLVFVFDSGLSSKENEKGCTLGSEKCVDGVYYDCEEDEEGNNFWASWDGDFPSGYTCDGDTLTCDPACEGGEKCINGTCVPFVSECSENIETHWYDENGENQSFNPVLECTKWCEKDSVNDELDCYEAPEDMVACSDNSDCNDWCQDKDEPCFCNFDQLENENSGSSAVVGGCAVASIRSEDRCILETCSENDMTWISARNFCKAIGLGIWYVDASGLSGGKSYTELSSFLKSLANNNPGIWHAIGETDDEGGIPVSIEDRLYRGGKLKRGTAVCD